MSIDNNQHDHLFDKIFVVNLHKLSLLDPEDLLKSIFSGFGSITYYKGDKFEFKFFVQNSYNKIGLSLSIDRDTSDENYINHFKGIDRYGSIWEFNSSGFGISLPGIKKGLPVISGQSEKLQKTEKLPDSFGDDYVEFIFSSDCNFPFNKSAKIEIKKDDDVIESKSQPVLHYEIDNFKIEGQKTDKFISIVFNIKNRIFNLNVRILEGLKFITGQQLNPGAIVTKTGKNLFTEFYSDHNSNYFKIEPPIRYKDYPIDEHIESWKLFVSFIDFISRYRSKYFTPVGAEINAIIGAGPAFFDTQLLTLSVHLEGMLNVLFPDFGAPTEKTIKEINKMTRYLEKYKSNDDVKKRLLTTILFMKQPRAKDKLIQLRKLGVINAIQYDSWNKLRNKTAHAVRSKSKTRFKKDMKRYYHVFELLYRIVFYAIDYHGEYTSYSDDNVYRKKFELYT